MRQAKQKPIKASRAVGYVRVSTDRQEMSPRAQAERIEKLADLQEITLVEVIEDHESARQGSIHSRSGVLRIMEMVRRKEVDRIIVAKLDRLTRSVVDLGELLAFLDKHNVTLVSATESWMDTGSAAGRMIINIMTSVAQWEREAIAERTEAVLRYKQRNNQAYNLLAYGARAVGTAKPGRPLAGKRLEPEPAEQAVIARAIKLRNQGRTLRYIAGVFNREKIPTKGRRRKTGLQRGKWWAATVQHILEYGLWNEIKTI
jgi:site-specific DNA recombinase